MAVNVETLDDMSWTELQSIILDLDEDDCSKFLNREKKTKRRKAYLLRLHARLNKVRAHRERAELKALAR